MTEERLKQIERLAEARTPDQDLSDEVLELAGAFRDVRAELTAMTHVANTRLEAVIAEQGETRRVQYLQRLAEYAEHSRSCPAFERGCIADLCDCGLDEVRNDR